MTDSKISIGTSLFYQEFNAPIAFDTEHTLSIELRGPKFIFKCNNETYQYDVTTLMYEPSGGQYRNLQSRVYADPGESGYIKTIFDDVYIFVPETPPGTPSQRTLPGIPSLLLD